MTPLANFVRLSPAERRIVLSAAIRLVGFRLALTLLPFRWVRPLAERGRRPRSTARAEAGPGVEELAWAVRSASRRVPRATCLVQALALQALLARYGHTSTLRIGVAKGDARELEAHAWLEREGSVLIGGAEAARFTPLPALPGRAGTSGREGKRR